ncbi:MAG: PorP/SprF family type IX secretion system membrane protein [Prevotella sp.]|nr:PorP/SprF family type IX secretion system membrane protein [Prevotella sp.]
MLRFTFVFKRKIIVLFALSLSLMGWAQYDVSFSHYFDLEPSFNPASVGKEAVINATAAYAMDLAGFTHNPQTMYFAGDMPFYALKTYHGVGIQLMSDKLGLFDHQRLAAQYAIRHKLFGGQLAYGVQVGMLSEKFDGSKVELEVDDDPVFTKSELNGTALDIDFGLYYTHRNWYAGVSAKHLTAPLVHLGETNELQIDRTYYLTGGYNIRLRSPFLKIKTSFLVRTDMVALRGDVTGRLVYTNDNKMMYLGAAYSPTNSVTFLIGGKVHGIVMGYSYEVYTSAINIGNGSHELFLGYQVDVNLVKKGRNLHKSVRIL